MRRRVAASTGACVRERQRLAGIGGGGRRRVFRSPQNQFPGGGERTRSRRALLLGRGRGGALACARSSAACPAPRALPTRDDALAAPRRRGSESHRLRGAAPPLATAACRARLPPARNPSASL